MIQAIKAIETVYNGYRFRSRLEARWAVFFDTLGIRYEYEKEGFDLGAAGFYLPDFWLPKHKCWIEIKPTAPTKDESVKAAELAAQSGQFVFVMSSLEPYRMGFDQKWVYHILGSNFYYTPKGDHDGGAYWQFCRKCASPSISFWLDENERPCPAQSDCQHEDIQFLKHATQPIINAFIAARSARFEHGETPRFRRN